MKYEQQDRRMPPCATCGHSWAVHIIPGGVDNLDLYPTERWCADCGCRNYLKPPPAEDPAMTELLAALDELYPLPDDDQRVERAGRTAFVLKRFHARITDDLIATIPQLVAAWRSGRVDPVRD